MKCLIVDDDEICRKAVALLLKGVAECEEAADGGEAIAKFSDALRREQPYQVIFLDILMPGIDGHETARQIRTIERDLSSSPKVKMIMLSVLNSVNDAMNSFLHGQCIAYVVKPVSEAKFITIFRELGII